MSLYDAKPNGYNECQFLQKCVVGPLLVIGYILSIPRKKTKKAPKKLNYRH